jgi:hypothetical protein
MLTSEQRAALEQVAKLFGWDKMPTEQVGVIMWCAFHYFASRVKR